MTSWSQDFTVKSNARRAARKAGVDPTKVSAFVKAGKTLFRFPMPDSNGLKRMGAEDKAKAKPANADKKSKRAAALRKTAGKPIDGLAAATGKPRRFKAPAKVAKTPKTAGKSTKSQTKARASTKASGSKFETVAAMLRRPGGAGMTAITAATGWKPHSARARISVDVSKLLTKGETIERRREAGESHYAIVPSKQMDLPIGEAA